MDGMQNIDIAQDYSAATRHLLKLGETSFGRGHDWPDYLASGAIGPDDIGDLVRMVCDPLLHERPADAPEIWSPVHAWRCLAQLRAAAAAAPLLALAERYTDDDAIDIEVPLVLGAIGASAMPAIEACVFDTSRDENAVHIALGALSEIGARHPDQRLACIAMLAQRLRVKGEGYALTNGLAVSALLDLKAVEAIEDVHDAYARGDVDITIAGDIEDVELDLCLRSERSTPRPNYLAARGWGVRPRRNDGKVGRNDPCPCGSGKKYKKCCLGVEEVFTAPPPAARVYAPPSALPDSRRASLTASGMTTRAF